MPNPAPVIRFAAARGTYYKVFLSIFFLLGVAVMVVGYSRQEGPAVYDWIMIGLWLAYIGLHTHRWFNTYYGVQDDLFYYRSGFNRGGIPVSSIRQIKPKQKGIGDFRAALSGRGMELIYNKYDDLFIAPQEPEKLIAELLKRNPAIEVQPAAPKAGAA